MIRRTKRHSIAGCCIALLLAACGQGGRSERAADVARTEEVPADGLKAAPNSVDTEARQQQPSAVSEPRAVRPQLAYEYAYSLELPPEAVVPLFERHRQACEAAGPARCQLLAASTEQVDETATRATLTLRATPDWLSAFRRRLAGDAKANDGRIAQSSVTSEDLGRSIIDTEAYLRAGATLRDRLQNLLATRTGKIGELLEIERELARVQGELDAARARLEDMRTRVAMSKMTIAYAPDELLLAGTRAGQVNYGADFVDTINASFLALVQLVAALLPWLLLAAPLVWLFRKYRRRSLGHEAQAEQPDKT